MYTLDDFGGMISDRARFGAYAEAIAAAVRPGDTVAEIGAGPGVFSLLACRAGARRVFAIEDDLSIQFGRDLAAANGFSGQIEFIHGDSNVTELPERVNVIISDLRGALPLYEHAVSSLEDARRRFLVDGGIMIPQCDTLKGAVVEANEYYRRITGPWRKLDSGVDLSPVRVSVLNQLHGVLFSNEQVLTPPLGWAVFDYTAGASANAGAILDFFAARKGTGHGLCLWFDAKLFGEIGYSSAPDAGRTVHGQIFLPWLEAVELSEGEQVHVELHADLVGRDYVWRWSTTIAERAGRREVRFQQSTFQGANYMSRSLRRRAIDYVPCLTEVGEADLWMLTKMDGKTTLQTIAEKAAERFPQLFASWQDAFWRAANLSSEFTR